MSEPTMTWTKQPPTEPGFYWVRANATGGQAIMCSVERVLNPVFSFKSSESLRVFIHRLSDAHALGLDELMAKSPSTEWAGPIVPPEDEPEWKISGPVRVAPKDAPAFLLTNGIFGSAID